MGDPIQYLFLCKPHYRSRIQSAPFLILSVFGEQSFSTGLLGYRFQFRVCPKTPRTTTQKGERSCYIHYYMMKKISRYCFNVGVCSSAGDVAIIFRISRPFTETIKPPSSAVGVLHDPVVPPRGLIPSIADNQHRVINSSSHAVGILNYRVRVTVPIESWAPADADRDGTRDSNSFFKSLFVSERDIRVSSHTGCNCIWVEPTTSWYTDVGVGIRGVDASNSLDMIKGLNRENSSRNVCIRERSYKHKVKKKKMRCTLVIKPERQPPFPSSTEQSTTCCSDNKVSLPVSLARWLSMAPTAEKA